MAAIMTPDQIEFVGMNMSSSWIEAMPPKEHPNFKSFVSVSSEDTPRFIILTKKQRHTLDFKIASQIFIDGNIFRYNKNNLQNIHIEDIDSN